MRNLLLLIVCLPFLGFGQLKEKFADKLFARMAYADCYEMYEELADHCIEKNKGCKDQNIERAAIADYKLYRFPQAEKYFKVLKEKNVLTESTREMYVSSLYYQEKYTEAETLIRESAYLFPENTYFKRHNIKIDRSTFYQDTALTKFKIQSFNSGKGDFSPTFYKNGLIYSSSARNTGFLNGKYRYDNSFYTNLFEVYPEENFQLENGKLLRDEFISRAHDGPVAFNSDETEMIITKNTLGKKNGKDVIRLSIYFSKLIDQKWTDLVPFTFNNPDYNVGHGVFADDNTMYFAMDKPGGKGGTDIYRSKRSGDTWSEPENLGDRINTEKNDFFPFVMDDILFFASEGHVGLGGLDVFEVGIDGGTPQNLGVPINSSADDFGLIIDTSNVGFISSNRDGYVDQIYRFKRRPIRIEIDGKVLAQYNEKEGVPRHPVYIKNIKTGVVDTMLTDDIGNFVKVIRSDEEYLLTTKKQEFRLTKKATASSIGVKKDSAIYCELLLVPTTVIIQIRVVEKGPIGDPIPLADVTVTDYETKTDTNLVSNMEGLVTTKVQRDKTYWVHGSKKGYIDGDQAFNTNGKLDKIIEVDLGMKHIEVGEKFKLENIFYDLNKSSLREESKIALDKLAAFLIKNDLKIELSAHTDARGRSSYNKRLSQARAQSCVDYLKSKGVKSSKMLARGYGESQLVNRCKDGVKCSEEEHQANRRTEVKILGM